MKRVRDVMTSEVTSLREEDELSLADDIMRLGRIRHLPVLDASGALVGILSGRDLCQSAFVRTLGYDGADHRSVLKTLRVQEVMTRDVQRIEPDALLTDAAERMLHYKLGCLPVVEDGKLVGILTEADFVALALEGRGNS